MVKKHLPIIQETRVRSLCREVSLIGYYKMLSRVPCAIQQDFVDYFVLIYSNMFILIPNS